MYLDGIGSAQAFNTVTVKTRIDGQLTEVDFTEGQDVKKGDLLAKIDSRPYEVALAQAQAVLQKDQSQLEDVRRNAVRDKQLVAQGVIPQQQADTQDSLLGQLQAAVLADQSQIDNAKLQIFYCQITAPIGGRVGLRVVDAGNMVHASDPGGLVVITQVQPIAVLFSLPEDNLPAVVARMRAGTTLSVRAMSRDSGTQLAAGTLLTIDNQIDQTTGTFRLKAVFDNQDRTLWPSQFVNARLLLDTERNATVIPAAAVQTGSKGTFVYALKPDNTVEIRPVKVGITQADIVSVDGVSPGEQIVTDGQDRLQAGTRVDAQSDVRGTDRCPRRRADRCPETETTETRSCGLVTSEGQSTAAGLPEGRSRQPAEWRPSGWSRISSGRHRQPSARRPMNPSRIFILRPVATTLLMIGLLLVGLVAYFQLPVSALPQVDYPTIQVLTFYPGAGPHVIESSVTAPLERQFGQVPGLKQMTSTSTFGGSLIILQFELNQNIDVAEQQVQAAINAGGTLLPTDLPNPPIYNKVNPADAPVLTLALTSDTMPLAAVQALADTTLVQKIAQLPGVGLVTISGGQKPAVRVQANPTLLASYGLSLEDMRTALAAANVDQAKGNIDGPRQSFTIGTNDQIFSAAQFKPVIIGYKNGAPVRVQDVADATDSIENVSQAAWVNRSPAVIVNIQRQPGANIIKVVDRIEDLLPQLKASLPPAVSVSILTDRTTTIRASVQDVEFEMMLTVALVVMVIFLFLRNLAATIIPSVAVPLSLIGTFAAMYLLNFSLDNLSLMALTISTGFVVDDAIVMIENITRYLEAGDEPLDAALKGAGQIGFTIVSLTVSLIAVLIPLLFMGDIVGRLFREFAITLSVTILLSAVVSLTLTPMMCSKILRHKKESESGALYRASERWFQWVIDRYDSGLQVVLRHQTMTLFVALGTLVLTLYLYDAVPKGFFPIQDTGVILGLSEAPEATSFTAMAQRQQGLADVILQGP